MKLRELAIHNPPLAPIRAPIQPLAAEFSVLDRVALTNRLVPQRER
jgi:hypothetical protein